MPRDVVDLIISVLAIIALKARKTFASIAQGVSANDFLLLYLAPLGQAGFGRRENWKDALKSRSTYVCGRSQRSAADAV